MTDFVPDRQSLVVEVRVYLHDELVHRELCESEEQAAAVVDAWSEREGVECEVTDLSASAPSGQALGGEPEWGEEDRPEQAELDAEMRPRHYA